MGVPVIFKNPGPAGEWQAGDFFGYLVLAGHGAELTDDDEEKLDEYMEVWAELDNPIPAVTEWGLVVMVLLGLIAGTIMYRKLRETSA